MGYVGYVVDGVFMRGIQFIDNLDISFGVCRLVIFWVPFVYILLMI